MWKWEYEYDDTGKQIKWNRFNEKNEIAGWTEYQYDSEGNKIKEISYYSDGTASSIKEYDEKGNEIKVIFYYEDGTIEWWAEYTSDGRYVKYVVYEEDGSRSESDYDRNGELRITTYYDAAGNITGWYDAVNGVDYNADGSVRE